MMRSMFSGVSGLRTHQTRMDVIANNIANVNTTGFKSSRMTFADTFSQTMSGASAPQPLLGRGGTNPMQVGLGVNVSSVQRMMSQGGAMRTDDPFHMMIDGDGFFIVGDGVGGTFFTRAGDFRRDRDYNIVMPNGLRLHGWPALTNPQGNLIINAQGQTDIDRVPVQGIQITEGMRTVPARATGNIVFDGNLDPTATVINTQMTFHDSLGNVFTMDVVKRPAMEPNPAGQIPAYRRVVGAWDVEFGGYTGATFPAPGSTATMRREDGTVVSLNPAPIRPQRMFFGTDGVLMHIQDYDIVANVTLTDQPGPFPAGQTGPAWTSPALTGALTTQIAFGITGAGLGVTFGQPNPPVPPGPLEIVTNFGAVTQMANRSTPVGHDQDGLRMGTLIGLSVGQDGIITGTYSNGQAFALWQIAVARFANPAGLESVGNNLFARTSNSGGFDNIGFEPGAISSAILAGTLEMSNVDLGMEFTEMITTQRGFQANSRIISTSDEILQELVNLRR